MRYHRLNDGGSTELSDLESASHPVIAPTTQEMEPNHINTRKKTDVDKWTTEQGFFALMGGYAAEIRFEDAQKKPQVKRWIITVEGIIF